MSLRMGLTLICALGLTAGVTGCVAEPATEGEFEDGLSFGKADGSSASQCELDAMVDYINGLDVSDERAARNALIEHGVYPRGAKCIVWWRLGMDTTRSGACPAGNLPADFEPEIRDFDEAQTIDDVRNTGKSTMRALLAIAADSCTEPTGDGAQTDVIFSPQPGYEGSHAEAIVEILNDPSTTSADIAMYSFSQPQVKAAVIDNAGRYPIRMIYDHGHMGRERDEDNRLTGLYIGGLEVAMEEAGIEVRNLSTPMHHKFGIFNAVHEDGDDPADTIVVSGSANWSNGAVSTYDESTVFIRNSPELALRFQREFNRLYERSRPTQTVHDDVAIGFHTMEITEEMIEAVDVPDTDVIFTSMNFRNRGSGLSVDTSNGYQMADRWIEAIENAEHSIWVFSERLRSVPIANALIAKAEANPDMEIRVYLDNQEYKTAHKSREYLADLDACYATASDEEERIACETSKYFGQIVSAAFGDNPNHQLRFKYYSYNWHYSFQQMHHKSMIIDGRYLYTGSYNLSHSSEFGNFENVMIFDGEVHGELVDSFTEAFDFAWHRGEDDVEELMSETNGTSSRVPIRLTDTTGYVPISMTWQQVDDWRNDLRDACGSRTLYDMGRNPSTERAMYCTRD